MTGRKPPRVKGPKPVVVPPLKPCPLCRVELQAGKGPNGLAWHTCAPTLSASSLEALEEAVLAQLVASTQDAPIKDLLAMLEAIRLHRAPKADGPGDGVADWLARR